MFTCFVCGYDKLSDPPYDGCNCASFDICPCCGVEFGYDDCNKTYDELRDRWIKNGMQWSSLTEKKPFDWNPELQIKNFLSK